MYSVDIFYEDDELVISGCINKRVPYEPGLNVYTSTGQAWFSYRDDGYPEKLSTWCRGKYGFGAACVHSPGENEVKNHYFAFDLDGYSDLIHYEHHDLMWVAAGNKCFINYSNGDWR